MIDELLMTSHDTEEVAKESAQRATVERESCVHNKDVSRNVFRLARLEGRKLMFPSIGRRSN